MGPCNHRCLQVSAILCIVLALLTQVGGNEKERKRKEKTEQKKSGRLSGVV
jgi:hypothetical protein